MHSIDEGAGLSGKEIRCLSVDMIEVLCSEQISWQDQATEYFAQAEPEFQ